MQSDVLNEEGVVIRGRSCTFTWSQQEAEGDGDHVSYDFCRVAWCQDVRDSQDAHNQCNRNWFDSHWGSVGLFVVFELSSDAEIDLSMGIFSRVDGPHAGKFLAHSSQGVLCCTRLDGDIAGGNAAVSIAM